EHHHRVGDDHHSLARVLARDHFRDGTQTKDDIAPALASRRSVVEFPEQPSELGLVRIVLSNSHRSQAVQNAELLFAKSLVDYERIAISGHSGGLDDEPRRVAGGFAVANEIEPIRPDLVGFHAHKQVKERTSFRVATGAASWCEPCNRVDHERNAGAARS